MANAAPWDTVGEPWAVEAPSPASPTPAQGSLAIMHATAGSGSTTWACSSCSCWCSRPLRGGAAQHQLHGPRLRPGQWWLGPQALCTLLQLQPHGSPRRRRSRAPAPAAVLPGCQGSAPARPSCSSRDQLRGSLCGGRSRAGGARAALAVQSHIQLTWPGSPPGGTTDTGPAPCPPTVLKTGR